jgi:hypothetical protein
LWSSSWQCDRCGDVHPFTIAPVANSQTLAHAIDVAKVPVWVPRPLPVGWVVSGIGWAGDERTGARAVAIACTGPNPLGGPADLVVVAEEPGVGLGARLAGLEGTDPGLLDGPPAAHLEAANHLSALWALPSVPDRAAFAGEARGVWLWVVFWPERASVLLMEHLMLADQRDGVFSDIGLVFGAPSPYLSATKAAVAAPVSER